MSKLILITGGSASGKTHLANMLKSIFNDKAILLSQDSFYYPGGDDKRNYDQPDAFDFNKQRIFIEKLLNGDSVEVPIYDFEVHDVVGHKKIDAAEFIFFEGLFTFNDYELAKMADFKIFVQTPSDTRLARRILRDVKERGRQVEEVVRRWLKDVQPSYQKYIGPVKKYADIIIPWHKIKKRALKSLAQTIVLLDKSTDEIMELINY